MERRLIEAHYIEWSDKEFNFGLEWKGNSVEAVA